MNAKPASASVLLLAALSAPAAAQDFATVRLGWQPSSALSRADAEEGSSDRIDEVIAGRAEDVTARFLSTDVRVMTPPLQLIPDRWVLINSPGFFHTRAVITGLDPAAGVDESSDLFGITWHVISGLRLAERWSLVAIGIPGLYSDFEAPLSGQDFLLQYMGFARFAPTEAVSVGLGGGYTAAAGAPRYFPVLQLGVETDRWRVSILAPQTGDVFYEVIDDSLSIGITSSLQGGRFHRGSDDSDDLFVVYSIGLLGPAVEKRLGRDGPLTLGADASYTLFRRFDLYEDEAPLYDLELERGWALQATLAFTPARR